MIENMRILASGFVRSFLWALGSLGTNVTHPGVHWFQSAEVQRCQSTSVPINRLLPVRLKSSRSVVFRCLRSLLQIMRKMWLYPSILRQAGDDASSGYFLYHPSEVILSPSKDDGFPTPISSFLRRVSILTLRMPLDHIATLPTNRHVVRLMLEC